MEVPSLEQRLGHDHAGLVAEGVAAYDLGVPNRTVLRVLGAVALAAATVGSTVAAGAADGPHAGEAAGPDAGPVVRLTVRWRPFGAQHQRAVIGGAAGKRRLVATAPAP